MIRRRTTLGWNRRGGIAEKLTFPIRSTATPGTDGCALNLRSALLLVLACIERLAGIVPKCPVAICEDNAQRPLPSHSERTACRAPICPWLSALECGYRWVVHHNLAHSMHRLWLGCITSGALAPHVAACGIEIAYFIYTRIPGVTPLTAAFPPSNDHTLGCIQRTSGSNPIVVWK
jgi:hypothetical protein